MSAELVPKAQDWRWGLLWQWHEDDKRAVSEMNGQLDRPPLVRWPVARPARWAAMVDQAMSQKDMERVHLSIQCGSSLGGVDWITRTDSRLSLGTMLTPRGRLVKKKD